ncbi:hypothetical protein LINGRAHAP2_LOCUS11172 [Linum grandiflorum]|jgi:DNA-binding PucR family transcriptional regulator
MPKKT